MPWTDDDTDLAGEDLGKGKREQSSALMSLLPQRLLHPFLKSCHKIAPLLSLGVEWGSSKLMMMLPKR